MRKADTPNTDKLKMMWPVEWNELSRRYNAGGGILPEDNMEPPKRDSGCGPDCGCDDLGSECPDCEDGGEHP